MMHLQDFPNEILTKIFSQIASHSAFELSTLSRFFYKLMRPIIYQRKITICFGDPEITFQSSWLQRAKKAQPPRAPDTMYRCLLLLRSVKENSDIGPLIAEVEFQWEVVLEEINSVEMANQLIETLPNLKTLVIQAERWEIGIDFHPHFLELNSMLMLKDVTLLDKQLTTKTVNRYLSLPHLEKLAIRCGLNGSYEEVDETLHNSSLRVLDLSGGYHTRAEIAHAIFKSHSKITSFYGTLFGTQKYSEYSRTSGYMASLLSPIEISDTMAPLQNSLERLELQLCRCKWIDRGYDSTRMDLSIMNNLRILQCPSKCFFPPQVGGVAPSRAGLYKLLPPNLEELTLQFEQTQMLFEEPKSTYFESKAEGVSRQLLWLDKVASNKKEYTPSLKLIVLDDPVKSRMSLLCRRRDQANLYLRQRWRAPGAVGEALAATGIVLKAEVDRISLNRVFGDVLLQHDVLRNPVPIYIPST